MNDTIDGFTKLVGLVGMLAFSLFIIFVLAGLLTGYFTWGCR